MARYLYDTEFHYINERISLYQGSGPPSCTMYLCGILIASSLEQGFLTKQDQVNLQSSQTPTIKTSPTLSTKLVQFWLLVLKWFARF